MSKYNKFFVALVPFVTTLVVHFFGAGSDVTFVVAAAVTALSALGVYQVANT